MIAQRCCDLRSLFLLLQGYFMRPTVITDISTTSRCMTEEIFGPVACVVPFEDENEVHVYSRKTVLKLLVLRYSCFKVIASANNVEYGLCAVIWSRDVSRIHRVARKLQVRDVITSVEYLVLYLCMLKLCAHVSPITGRNSVDQLLVAARPSCSFRRSQAIGRLSGKHRRQFGLLH